MASHSELDDEPEMVDGGNNDEYLDSEISEGDDEEEDEEEVDVKNRFDKILDELKSGRLDLNVPQQRKSFLDRNGDVLSKQTSDEHQNLLHILANNSTSNKESLPSWGRLEPLVQILVKLPANLLAMQDGDNKTPLYIAASRARRKHKLLRAMCEEYSKVHGESRGNIQGNAYSNIEGNVHSNAESEAHSNTESGSEVHGIMDSVLCIQCFNMETCLHVVIRKMVPQEHVLDLIKRASHGTLCAQDNKGNTPLHVAVDYNLCLDGQIKVVEALVNKSDEAMGVVNANGMSPYRYHEETRREALKRATNAQEAQGNQCGSQGPPKALPPSQETSHVPQSRRLPARANTLTDEPPGKYGAGSARGTTPVVDSSKNIWLTGSQDVGQVSTSTSTSVRTPAQEPVAYSREARVSKKGMKTKTGPKEGVNPSPKSADAIKSFLKLSFLRKRNHDAALDFLYGSSSQGIHSSTNQLRQAEYQINFDLYGCPSEVITQRQIRKNIANLQFEDVLQYVAVPQVRIVPEPESKSRPASQGEDHNRSRGSTEGRTDLVLLFKWLRNDKKVKTILKVIVDDLQEPAHSDQAIEDALDGAGVEIWDWRKADLCSEVIYKVAPKARIVHLYWNGRNSILRGWSEAEGLAKLKNLEKVYLNLRQVRISLSNFTPC